MGWCGKCKKKGGSGWGVRVNVIEELKGGACCGRWGGGQVGCKPKILKLL